MAVATVTLPDLAHERQESLPAGAPTRGRVVVLSDRYKDRPKAAAVPGAVWAPRLQHPPRGAWVLPFPTPRAAIVALTLFPGLENEYPELAELRAALIQDVHPTDYATRAGIVVEAAGVRDTLLDQGSDWSVWGHLESAPDGGVPGQATDLGYAAAQLERLGGFYLGWSRGYGKTLGTAAIIEANGYQSVLIGTLNSAKEDVWVRELDRRLPSHEVIVMGNTGQRRAAAIEDALELQAWNEPFVLIAHHEALALVAGTRERPSGRGKTVLDGWKQLGIEWDLFTVDEGHRLKNPASQLHRAACKVPARRRLVLSGSVYENSWEELYGPLHFILPAAYKSKWDDWNTRFLDFVEGYGKVCVGILDGREQAMRDELGVFMVVREKPDLSHHETLMVELSTEQRRVYDELAEVFFTQLADDTTIVAEAGISALTKLRQIATGLELLTAEVADSSKLDAVVDLLQRRPDDDFFIACWYKASGRELEDRLWDAGFTLVYRIDGDVPMKRRTEIIQEARRLAADRDEQIILIGTIPTLGESVNLQFLNHVVRLDRSWNPALNRQVVDRVDRQGQNRKVTCTDVIASDTVDELVVLPNLASKDALRAIVLGRGA